MNSLNLFLLSRINDVDTFAKFEKQLSGREVPLKVKKHEMLCVIELVNSLLNCGAQFSTLDGFYYSFVISQIGKEFDLLRIGDSEIVNIELKSQQVQEEEIQSQLVKNKYYLSHLERHISLYTFIKSNKKLYYLDDSDILTEGKISNLNNILENQSISFYGDINSLFRVSDFLVSPLNTPDKFLDKKYFLTLQQNNYKKQFFEKIDNKSCKFVGITGSAGTGKTLFLYDLAMQCSTIGKCCLIHCGILSSGHYHLNKRLYSINIIDVKSITNEFDFSNYRFIFIDESHRIYKNQFNIIVTATYSSELITVFSFDSRQTLSKYEDKAAIASHIKTLPNYAEFKLSDKVRTNKELASFIRRLINLYSTDIKPNYPSVSIAYANDYNEAQELLNQLKKKGFTFINYTTSNYNKGTFDSYVGDYNTHRVIGQEFDNVVMLMDDIFFYDHNGKLQGREHPNPDYLYRQLLFQGLTRVREKLALIIIKDQSLFQKILSILQ